METKGEEKLGTADHIVRVREGFKNIYKKNIWKEKRNTF